MNKSNSAENESEKNVIKEFSWIDQAIAGAFSGFTSRIVSAPFDFLKIRMQLQSPNEVPYTSMLHACRRIIKEEGITAFWKGNLTAIYLWISYSMVQFTVYSTFKKFGFSILERYREDKGEKTYSVKSSSEKVINYKSSHWVSKSFVLFCAGACAGCVATIATYPLDIMRTQFVIQNQTHVFPNYITFVSYTYKHRGLQGFFAGITPTLIGITPYLGLNFVFYESLRSLTDLSLKSSESQAIGVSIMSRFFSNGICGGLAGGAAKFIVYPLDTIKKRIQKQSLIQTHDTSASLIYKGTLDCGQKILSTEGLRGLYRGIIPSILKSLTSSAMSFASYEAAKDILEWTRTSRRREKIN